MGAREVAEAGEPQARAAGDAGAPQVRTAAQRSKPQSSAAAELAKREVCPGTCIPCVGAYVQVQGWGCVFQTLCSFALKFGE